MKDNNVPGNKVIFANICLLLAAMLWGSQIAFQKFAADVMSPIGFYTFRCISGSAVMGLIVIVMEWKDAQTRERPVFPINLTARNISGSFLP